MKNFENPVTTINIAAVNDLYDLSMLEEMDDSEYLLDILNVLFDETPKDIKEMQVALQSGKIDIVCKKAHKLKSSAGVIQAEKLTALLKDIEELGKKGMAGSELSFLVDTAAQQYRLIETALKVYIQQLK